MHLLQTLSVVYDLSCHLTSPIRESLIYWLGRKPEEAYITWCVVLPDRLQEIPALFAGSTEWMTGAKASGAHPSSHVGAIRLIR